MSAPAQRSVQEIAREAAVAIDLRFFKEICGEDSLPDYKESTSVEFYKATVLRAIAEAVKATGAREHLIAYRDEQAGFAQQIISPRRLHDEYAERAGCISVALAALDELGRAAE